MLLDVQVLAGLGQPDELRLGEEGPDGLLVGFPDVLGLLSTDEEDRTLVLGVGGEEQVRVVRHQVWKSKLQLVED